MPFEVKTEHFSGPFDLLLELIEKRKLFINEVSLSQVTDDFIDYIESRETFPLNESAQFILVASTLLLIKSRSLLPGLELTVEEQEDIRSLEKRLAVYKIIKDAGKIIQGRFGKNISFQPSARPATVETFAPGKTDMAAISSAIATVLYQLPKIQKLPEVVVKKVLSLEETIEKLSVRVSQGLRLRFKEFTGAEKVEKINVIVSFLAMLELVKRGVIRAEQSKTFDEIDIETTEVGVPRYE